MKCGDCPEGQRHSKSSVFCPLYGIIISKDHDCEMEGGKQHEERNESEDRGQCSEDETELQNDGADIA